MSEMWVTADSLIESFGDQAYHKGTRMMVEMASATPDDVKSIGELWTALMELIRRQYHTRHREAA